MVVEQCAVLKVRVLFLVIIVLVGPMPGRRAAAGERYRARIIFIASLSGFAYTNCAATGLSLMLCLVVVECRPANHIEATPVVLI